MPDTVHLQLQQVGARDTDVRLLPTITRDVQHVQRLVSGQRVPLDRCNWQTVDFVPFHGPTAPSMGDAAASTAFEGTERYRMWTKRLPPSARATSLSLLLPSVAAHPGCLWVYKFLWIPSMHDCPPPFHLLPWQWDLQRSSSCAQCRRGESAIEPHDGDSTATTGRKRFRTLAFKTPSHTVRNQLA